MNAVLMVSTTFTKYALISRRESHMLNIYSNKFHTNSNSIEIWYSTIWAFGIGQFGLINSVHPQYYHQCILCAYDLNNVTLFSITNVGEDNYIGYNKYYGPHKYQRISIGNNVVGAQSTCTSQHCGSLETNDDISFETCSFQTSIVSCTISHILSKDSNIVSQLLVIQWQCPSNEVFNKSRLALKIWVFLVASILS